MKLINNYHTHTFRCGHASGTDEDYVINAVKAGIKELGFSDHIPFKNVTHHGVRMDYSELDDYIISINNLKEKYKDQIKIYLGFEAEYYREIKEYYSEILVKVDYLICGQHFLLTKANELIYTGYPTDDKDVLIDYTDRVIEAIESGLFKYIAHPDIILRSYTIRDEFVEQQMRRICEAAERCHIPLEINLEGFKKQIERDIIGKEQFYPFHYFWNIVKDYNIDVIIGADVHVPTDFLATHDKYGYEIVDKYNLHLINKIDIM